MILDIEGQLMEIQRQVVATEQQTYQQAWQDCVAQRFQKNYSSKYNERINNSIRGNNSIPNLLRFLEQQLQTMAQLSGVRAPEYRGTCSIGAKPVFNNRLERQTGYITTSSRPDRALIPGSLSQKEIEDINASRHLE